MPHCKKRLRGYKYYFWGCIDNVSCVNTDCWAVGCLENIGQEVKHTFCSAVAVCCFSNKQKNVSNVSCFDKILQIDFMNFKKIFSFIYFFFFLGN